MEPQEQQSQAQQLLMQVVELLKGGMSPDELLKMGVPQELLDQAMSMVQQEMQSGAGPQSIGQQAPQPQPAGLADMYAQGGM
jgi:hypothetical protein